MSDLLNKVMKTFFLHGREKQMRRQERCGVSVCVGLVLSSASPGYPRLNTRRIPAT